MTCIYKYLYLFSMIIVLGGCQQNHSIDYLLEHPDVLKTELSHCENRHDVSIACENAKKADETFFALVNHRIENPEKFGLQIMQAEQQMVTLKNNKQNFQNQAHQVRVLLAVVAATSHIE